MPYVRIKTGPDKGKVFEIKDQPVTIGRDKVVTIQILDQGSSRNHAEIFKLGELYIIRDVTSTNGTFVNSIKIQEEILKDADEVLIGSTILVFEDKPGASTPNPVEVQFDESGDVSTTTVQIAVEKDHTRKKELSLGREIDSRNLSVTHEIARVIASEANLETVMTKTLDVVVKAINGTHAYFLTIDRASGKMSPRFRSVREGASIEVKLSRAIVKHVLKTLLPALTSDAMVDERFSFSESIVLKKIRSVMCVPLLTPGDVAGVLYFHKSEGSNFTVEDLELASQVALQLSMSFEAFKFKGHLRKSMASAVRALIQAMEFHDPGTQGHSNRVADYAQAIAIQLGLPRDEVFKIRLSALLHDVGKLSSRYQPSGVIQKPGDAKEPRDDQHVQAGEKIVMSMEGGADLVPGVKYHHERADGSGWPAGAKNEEIPMMGRIVIVANAFDNALGPDSAEPRPQVSEVIRQFSTRGGSEFDEQVLKALLICHRNNTLYNVPDLFPEG